MKKKQDFCKSCFFLCVAIKKYEIKCNIMHKKYTKYMLKNSKTYNKMTKYCKILLKYCKICGLIDLQKQQKERKKKGGNYYVQQTLHRKN